MDLKGKITVFKTYDKPICGAPKDSMDQFASKLADFSISVIM